MNQGKHRNISSVYNKTDITVKGKCLTAYTMYYLILRIVQSVAQLCISVRILQCNRLEMFSDILEIVLRKVRNRSIFYKFCFGNVEFFDTRFSDISDTCIIPYLLKS